MVNDGLAGCNIFIHNLNRVRRSVVKRRQDGSEVIEEGFHGLCTFLRVICVTPETDRMLFSGICIGCLHGRQLCLQNRQVIDKIIRLNVALQIKRHDRIHLVGKGVKLIKIGRLRLKPFPPGLFILPLAKTQEPSYKGRQQDEQ